MKTTISKVGLPENVCRHLAWRAKKNDWTPVDVEVLVDAALTSKTLRSPAAFVTHRINHDIKLPPRGETFGELVAELACPVCHTVPCTCDWDPQSERWADYRHRVTVQPGAGVL